MKRAITLPIIVLLLALPLVGCGDKTKVVSTTTPNGQVQTRTVPDVKFAKTKFVLHSGLAIGAFQRYIYKPYRAGAFKKNATGRKKALAKAAVAGLFTLRELKQARRAAESDDKLRPLADKIGGLTDKLGGVIPALRGGSLNPGDLIGIATGVTGLGDAAKGLGAPIKERNAPGL